MDNKISLSLHNHFDVVLTKAMGLFVEDLLQVASECLPFPLAWFYKIRSCIYSLRLGAGVIGIVNIPLEIMEPSHNKQEFLNVQEYNHLLKVMGQYLIQYCKDTGISEYSVVIVRVKGLKFGIHLRWKGYIDWSNQ